LDLKFNNKILDALAWIELNQDLVVTDQKIINETRFFVLEGTIRSAKTVTAIIGFHRRVQMQKGKFALIAAKDFDSINDNILNAELGLFVLYPDAYKLKKDKIGGYYVEVVGTDKKILLAGYSDTAKWKKILGKDIETILIDEINIADEMFVRECFARQGATEHPIMICTLNGDDPNHVIYQERINKCLMLGKIPAEIRADMDKQKAKKKGYYYTHWSFDDNPKLKPKQKRNLRTLYPVGSYYHKTKTLGLRGKWGKLIFADYMTPDLLVNLQAKDSNQVPIYPIAHYTIGIDIAENRAANVFALVGWSKDYEGCRVVDIDVFPSKENGKSVGYKYKTKRLKEFLFRYDHIHNLIEGIFVDSAENNYIMDLQTENLGIPVAPSYKATIKERIDMIIILMNALRLLFDSLKASVGYYAYQASVWTPGKEGKEREDNNLPMNDIMDAIEYAITRHMRKLLLAVKRVTK